MALDRTLDRVGDDLAARERIAHAFVVHGDAIANADRGHLHWRAPCHAHACLHRISDGLQVNMARDDLVLRGNDRNKRTIELFVGETVSLEQAAVWRAGQSFFDRIAAHGHHSF